MRLNNWNCLRTSEAATIVATTTMTTTRAATTWTTFEPASTIKSSSIIQQTTATCKSCKIPNAQTTTATKRKALLTCRKSLTTPTPTSSSSPPAAATSTEMLPLIATPHSAPMTTTCTASPSPTPTPTATPSPSPPPAATPLCTSLSTSTSSSPSLTSATVLPTSSTTSCHSFKLHWPPLLWWWCRLERSSHRHHRHHHNWRRRWPTLVSFLVLYWIALATPPAAIVEASTLDIYKNARLGHRIVQTRYGRLHGLILPLDSYRFLRSVEVFLGVPYATPPTKQNRFSPTRAPAPWDGIRISDKYSPVCPQRLPNIQNETAALEKMPKGRLEYLKRLLPFLENQSEDCLYLNIFSPINGFFKVLKPKFKSVQQRGIIVDSVRFTLFKIGLLVRYSVWFLISILLLLIARFSFLPGTPKHYERIFTLNWKNFVEELIKLPAYGICAFGPGWGLFISLASFNHFKTNITRSSWLIGIGQMFIIFGLDVLEKSIDLFLKSSTINYYIIRQETQFRTLFMSSGSVLATMSWPNLWCILFYLMLSVASMILMILQLHSILTSIFDEFVSLRQYRSLITFTIIAIMAVFSLYFATMHGYAASTDLILDTVMAQSLINLLLILVVTWFYGRIRFQRDMTFMTGTHFATWKIYILRFFAPLCMLAVLFATIVLSIFNSFFMNPHTPSSFDLILKTLPWWSIPGYIIYTLYRSQGSLKERFIKCCRPTDWFPVEAAERQRYEEVMNISNMTHPLSELSWDDDIENA